MDHSKTQKSLPKIRPFLLWDVNTSKLDYLLNKKLVIERACTLGNIADYKEVVRFYGIETIKEELVSSASLDPKSLNYFSRIFNIPIGKFKCYSKKL